MRAAWVKRAKKKQKKTRRCFEENLMKFQKISVFKTLTVLIKPFDAPQRSVKTRILGSFHFNTTS